MKPVILLKRLELLTGNTALDVGARDCVNALELAKSGFVVDAVDTKDCPSPCVAENITYIKSRFEELPLDKKYDVVIARHVVPFLSTSIEASLHKLIDLLAEKGVLYVSFFGSEDGWAGEPDVQIAELKELREMTSEHCTIAYESEERFDGKTYAGTMKGWHVITMVLVKK